MQCQMLYDHLAPALKQDENEGDHNWEKEKGKRHPVFFQGAALCKKKHPQNDRSLNRYKVFNERTVSIFHGR